MTHEPIDYALAAGILASPFALLVAWIEFRARRIARSQFKRLFRHVVMIRGKNGRFDRL